MKKIDGIKVDCSCGESFTYKGTSKRYARCRSCGSRKNIEKLLRRGVN